MFNTIILLHGESRLNHFEKKRFQKGDTILGDCSDPEELKRWSIDQEDEARAELTKHKCTYEQGIALFDVEEYALEYCECDEDGEFVEGSNYDFAEEEMRSKEDD
jgi:hypothetical protein